MARPSSHRLKSMDGFLRAQAAEGDDVDAVGATIGIAGGGDDREEARGFHLVGVDIGSETE